MNGKRHAVIVAMTTGLAQLTVGGLVLSAGARPAGPVVSVAATVANPVHSLRVVSVTASAVSLSWVNPSAATFAGVVVRSAIGATAPSTPSMGHLVAKLRKPAHSATAKGLAPSTKYSFAVFPYTATGKYGTVAKITATTTSGFLTGVKTVVTNSYESCALFNSGKVDCWGYNSSDNLGSGVATDYVLTPVPVKAIGGQGVLTGVTSLATDGAGFCGVLTSSSLDCWGDNGDGDLGIASSAQPAYPVAVKGIGGSGNLTGVDSVTGGAFSYCAVLQSGGVDCWGNNRYGDLGTGSTASSSDTVQAVKSTNGSGQLTGVASVVSNGNEMCAILTSTSVDCWGRYPLGTDANNNGESDIPVVVHGVGNTPTLTGVANLSAQASMICAVLTSGGVDCWGGIALGAGDNEPLSTDVPVQVEGVGGTGFLSGVADVVGDSATSCALLTSGGVDCWGNDNAGQLGVSPAPMNAEATSPQPVVGPGGTGSLTGVTQLAITDLEFCAVLGSGHVNCWGWNKHAALGNGTITGPDSCGNDPCGKSPAPVVSTSGAGSLAEVAGLVSDSGNKIGGFGFYAVLTSGGVDYWGAGTNAQGLFNKDPFQDSDKYSVPAQA